MVQWGLKAAWIVFYENHSVVPSIDITWAPNTTIKLLQTSWSMNILHTLLNWHILRERKKAFYQLKTSK